jgi:hypothetical protein
MDLASNLLRRRWWVAIVFAILATVGLVASVASNWTHSVLFDTDKWMETVGPIGTNEVVTDALSDRFSQELIDWVDADGRLTGLLPPLLAPLGRYAASFVDTLIVQETDRFFTSDLYANSWETINRSAHTAAVAIIRDEVPNVSTAGGVVTVDLVPVLTPIVDRVFDRMRQFGEAVPDVLLNRVDIDETIADVIQTYETEGLPQWLSEIEVYQSDSLAAIQQTTAILDRLVWILPVLTLLFAAGALYYAPLRWRMGAILLASAALGWLLAVIAVNAVVGAVVSGIDSDTSAAVANEVFTGVTSGLTSLLWVLIIVATVAALAVVGWTYYSARRPTDAEVPTA